VPAIGQTVCVCVELAVNGSAVDDESDAVAAAVVSSTVTDGEDERWEQVRSRNRTVFNNTVCLLRLRSHRHEYEYAFQFTGCLSLVCGLYKLHL